MQNQSKLKNYGTWTVLILIWTDMAQKKNEFDSTIDSHNHNQNTHGEK